MNTETFDEFRLSPEQVAKVQARNHFALPRIAVQKLTFVSLRLVRGVCYFVQGGFAQLVENAGSPEAAGDAVYSTLFEAHRCAVHLASFGGRVPLRVCS